MLRYMNFVTAFTAQGKGGGGGEGIKGRAILGKGVSPRPLRPEMFISQHPIKFCIENKVIF